MPLISYFDLNCIIPGAVRRSGGDSPGNAPKKILSNIMQDPLT